MIRAKVVAAVTKAIDDEIGAEMREHLAHVLRKWPNTIESLAEAALDAMLDVLAWNAMEWIEAEAQMDKRTMHSWQRQQREQLERLVEVLREPR